MINMLKPVRPWVVASKPGDLTNLHSIPMYDQMQHSNVDCVCGPTSEEYINDEGREVTLHRHFSLDGREEDELDQDYVTSQWAQQAAQFIVAALIVPKTRRGKIAELYRVLRVIKRKGIPSAHDRDNFV